MSITKDQDWFIRARANRVNNPASRGDQPPGWRRAARRGLMGVVVVAAGYYALCVLLLLVYRFASPPITGVQAQRRVAAWFADGPYAVQHRIVPYSRIPAHVRRAVVSAEDRHFWDHAGFDFEEMRIAGMAIFDGERPRGASTITQQLMKNLFGTTHRNPVRKLYDLALTPVAELVLPKERILELYLNNVEWGPGIFGVASAARYHYGTTVTNLTRTQAAGLAALLPNPLRRTPANTPQYRSEILRRMGQRGW